MKSTTALSTIFISLSLPLSTSFLVPNYYPCAHQQQYQKCPTTTITRFLSQEPEDEIEAEDISSEYNPDESMPDEAGIELGSMFAQFLKEKNLSSNDVDDDTDIEEESEETTTNIDTLVSLQDDLDTDDEYSGSTIPDSTFNSEFDKNIKERMLSSPQSLIDLNVDLDMDLEDDDGEGGVVYSVPEKVPDSNLSAGEVVQLRTWSFFCSCVCSSFSRQLYHLTNQYLI